MPTVLTLNGGSSSIRFALYESADATAKLLDGKIDRIGTQNSNFIVTQPGRDTLGQGGASGQGGALGVRKDRIDARDHGSAVEYLMRWFASQQWFASLGAVGHRVVHGMQHSNPERVTPALLAELKSIVPYDPEHLPRELQLIDGVTRTHPTVPQVVCFDTAFHRTMPRVATILPIPRRFEAKGMQRYGFHGLSYTYLMSALVRLGDPAATRGRVILAHLGNGASLAAVRDGGCIDTSMGFTPASGLVMSTRAGDVDPGIMSFLALTESMDAAAYQKMVTHESGLLGISETSADIRDLLQSESDDVRAAEAVALFCYQVKKWIGAFTSALGGLDTLVFAGGIGENAAPIRARICAGIECLGVELDESRNCAGARLISSGARSVAVRVIRTDEESVIAQMTCKTLALNTTQDA